MRLSKAGIPSTLRFAFQEYDLDQLSLEEDAFTIIERTLAYRNQDELLGLFLATDDLLDASRQEIIMALQPHLDFEIIQDVVGNLLLNVDGTALGFFSYQSQRSSQRVKLSWPGWSTSA